MQGGDYLGVFLCQLGLHEEGLLRLEDKAVNSHRAIDDARAAALALEAMAAERDDLERYVDLFGAHPKYGVSGRRISSVTYRAQPYERVRPLYELA